MEVEKAKSNDKNEVKSLTLNQIANTTLIPLENLMTQTGNPLWLHFQNQMIIRQRLVPHQKMNRIPKCHRAM